MFHIDCIVPVHMVPHHQLYWGHHRQEDVSGEVSLIAPWMLLRLHHFLFQQVDEQHHVKRVNPIEQDHDEENQC